MCRTVKCFQNILTQTVPGPEMNIADKFVVLYVPFAIIAAVVLSNVSKTFMVMAYTAVLLSANWAILTQIVLSACIRQTRQTKQWVYACSAVATINSAAPTEVRDSNILGCVYLATPMLYLTGLYSLYCLYFKLSGRQ